jgi:hypothetical protein
MEYLLLINCMFVVFNGWLCWVCFRNDNRRAAWVNLFASALNAAVVLDTLV